MGTEQDAAKKAAEEKAAEEKAKKEAAEKEAARVAAVSKQISQLQSQVSDCVALKEALHTSKVALGITLKTWEQTLSSCTKKRVMKEVVIKKKFEGTCAAKIKNKLPVPLASMAKHTKASKAAKTGAEGQITKLEAHIDTLNSRIRDLRASI